ncbi:MAG: hypothetical protein ACE1ZI_03140, partial [Acidobacteriota bacterium]
NLFSLCRPYRALICYYILPRACALGYFMAPRWGSRAQVPPTLEMSTAVDFVAAVENLCIVRASSN